MPSKHNSLRRLQGNVAPSPVGSERSLQISPDKAQAREPTATTTASNAPRSHPAPPSCTLTEACILDEPGQRISPVIADDLRTPAKNSCRLKSKVVRIQPPKGVRLQAVNKDKGKSEPDCPTPPTSLAVTVEESNEQPSKHGCIKEASIFNNKRPNAPARDACTVGRDDHLESGSDALRHTSGLMNCLHIDHVISTKPSKQTYMNELSTLKSHSDQRATDTWTVGVANQLKSGSDALNDNSGLPLGLHGEHETNGRYNQHTLHGGGRPRSIGRARNIVSRVPQEHSAAITYKRQPTQPSDRPLRSLSDDRTGLDLYKDRADRPFILESGRKDHDMVSLGRQGSRQPVKPGGSTSCQSQKGVSTAGRAGAHLPTRPTADVTGQSGTQASNRMRGSQADAITDTVSDPPSAYFSGPENTLQPGAVPDGAFPPGGSQDETSNFHMIYAPNFTKEATSRTPPVQSRAEPEPTTQEVYPQPPTIHNEPKTRDTMQEAPSAKSTIQSRAESGDITQETAPSHPSIQSKSEPGPATRQATSSTPMLQTNPKPSDTIKNPAFEAPAIESKTELGSINQRSSPITPTKYLPFTPEAALESTEDVPDSPQKATPSREANPDVSADVEAVADWMIKMTHKPSPSGKHPDA